MTTLLKLLLPLVTLLSSLWESFRWHKEKQNAAAVAEAEIATREAEVSREATTIVGQSVPDSTAHDRLRTGDF